MESSRDQGIPIIGPPDCHPTVFLGTRIKLGCASSPIKGYKKPILKTKGTPSWPWFCESKICGLGPWAEDLLRSDEKRRKNELWSASPGPMHMPSWWPDGSAMNSCSGWWLSPLKQSLPVVGWSSQHPSYMDKIWMKPPTDRAIHNNCPVGLSWSCTTWLSGIMIAHIWETYQPVFHEIG